MMLRKNGMLLAHIGAVALVLGLFIALYSQLMLTQEQLVSIRGELLSAEALAMETMEELRDAQFELHLVSCIAAYRPNIPATELAAEVFALARQWGASDPYALCLDIIALGGVESEWRTDQVGKLGERGPLQVKPATARDMGLTTLEFSDWRRTLAAGVRYFARVCLPRAQGNRKLAIAYYNAGPYRDSDTALRLANRYVSNVEFARGLAEYPLK